MVSVQPLHTFGLEAEANRLIRVKHIDDLMPLITKQYNSEFIIIGEGSNSVFVDNYSGDLVRIELQGIEIQETPSHYLVTAAAGENWHEFVSYCLQQQIWGLENLALIPGTVGASPIQNIGAYGIEVSQFIESLTYFDLKDAKLKTMSKQECEFGYRDSIFKNRLLGKTVITSVTFSLPKNWSPVTTYGDLATLERPTANDIFEKVIEIRQSKLPDPKILGNAGSFFKNPIIDKECFNALKSKFPQLPAYPAENEQVKIAAGWLIDQAGLKGQMFDGVAVHDKQALVLVNKSGIAKGRALLCAVEAVINKVLELYGIELTPEVRIYGKLGEVSPSHYLDATHG